MPLVCALAVGLGVAIAALSQTLSTNAVSTTALFAFVALIVCIWPLARRAADGTFDLFEPIVLASVMLGILCGFRPIITIITGDYVLNNRFNAEPYFDKAVLLGFACTVAFVGAYELTSLVYRARPSSRRRDVSVSLRAALLYGASISAFALVLYALYVQHAGGIGNLLAQRSIEVAAALGNTSEYLSAAPVAIACASILLVLACKGNPRGANKLLAIALAMLPAALFAFLGNRRFIIPSLMLPLVVGYLESGRRPNKARVAMLVPLAFIVLATIPFARTEGASNEAGGRAAIYKRAFAQPGKTVARFANGPDTDMLLYLSLQMQNQRSSGDFFYGKATVGDFVLAPIPSSVFPNKPVTARNELLQRLFGSPCTAVGGGVCPDFSVIGTFYQDFWAPGAIFGMALMGAFAAGLWRRFVAAPHSPYVILLTAATSIYLPIIIRAGLLPASTWALYFVIPTAIGIRVARRLPRMHTAGPRTAPQTAPAPLS